MSTGEPPELGITEADREELRRIAEVRWGDAKRTTPRKPPARPAHPEATLPCGCGPGVKNIMDTASELDYECPTCGRTFTRDEV